MVMKSLYFLHIPKTAGQFITESIVDSLDLAGISNYFPYNGAYLSEQELGEKIYIGSHFGTYPIEKIKGIETVTILRDPLSRAISQFNFLYEDRYKELYSGMDNYMDKLKFYMFEDSHDAFVKNYQARFLSNPASEKRFNSEQDFLEIRTEAGEMFRNSTYPNTWFVRNHFTSFEKAKETLDYCKFVGVSENLGPFLQKLDKWFFDNHNIHIEFKKDLVNVSNVIEDGILYNAKICKDLLSEQEKQRFKENNKIDYALYEYAKILNI
jgi:hypothetical protein